ncbi:MAG: metal-sulfur cluster assembly factor [Chloroflexota bacterium]
MTIQEETRSTPASLREALHAVEDPELPISIVDMGLIVDLRFEEGVAYVQITFTAMGCPAIDMIVDDVRECLLREPGVNSVQVEIVWSPIWTKDRLSDDGKFQLRSWGISL